MMIATNPEFSPVSLVKPPPKLATPDQGSLPSVPGAGSTSPIPGSTPQPVEGVTALPFGNGVTPPVLMAPPTGAPVGDPMVNIPQLSPVSMPGGDPNNLLGTLIAPPAGGTPGSDPFAGVDTIKRDLAEPDLTAAPLDPRVGNWNSRVDSAAGALDNTDRRSMLSSLLSDFDKQAAERDDNSYTQVGRRDAALGRLGSGMTSQTLAQIARQSMGDKQIFRNQLAADTIDKEIGDRFGKLSAFNQVGNDAFGQASSNRGFQFGVDSGNRDFRQGGKLNAYNLAGSAADRTAQNSRLDRNEYRTERDFQNAQQQQGIDRKVQQVQVEEALKSGDFNRALQLLQQGKTGSPASAYAGAAGDLSGQSGNTAQLLMQFLNSMGYNSGSRAA